MNKGTTSQDIRWSFAPKSKTYTFRLEGQDGATVEQTISRRDHKELTRDSGNLISLMELMAPHLLDKTMGSSIGIFVNLHKLKQEHFLTAMKVSDPWIQLAMLRFYCANPEESAATALRIASILKTIPSAQNSLDSHYLNQHVSVQKISVDQWLDTFDFMVNGGLRETYRDFHKKHAGRVFTLPYTVNNDKYAASVTYRPDDLELRYSNISHSMHRFVQLARRSRKLENKLYTMPLDKLLQALDFQIPGTLLVIDTVELLDSLKHVKLRNSKKVNTSYYGSPNMEAIFGKTLANKLDKEGLTNRMARFLTYSYRGPLITDASGMGPSHQAVPFIVHSMRKLGTRETVDILETIERETDGVSMRGFMELVRRGGFTGPEPAAWTAVLLANK